MSDQPWMEPPKVSKCVLDAADLRQLLEGTIVRKPHVHFVLADMGLDVIQQIAAEAVGSVLPEERPVYPALYYFCYRVLDGYPPCLRCPGGLLVMNRVQEGYAVREITCQVCQCHYRLSIPGREYLSYTEYSLWMREAEIFMNRYTRDAK